MKSLLEIVRLTENAESLLQAARDEAMQKQLRCGIDRSVLNSDYWAAKTDFVKLRSISLAYDVPERFVRYAKSATFIVSGQNLWRWTKYDGADPEANDATDAGTGLGRREYYQIPPFKTMLFSIRATF